MQFERQMTDRRRVRVVNLNFIEIDRMRRTRAHENRGHQYKQRENMSNQYIFSLGAGVTPAAEV